MMTSQKEPDVIAPKEQPKPVAVFHAYDVDDVLRYGLSSEVLEQVNDFRQWLRSIVEARWAEGGRQAAVRS